MRIDVCCLQLILWNALTLVHLAHGNLIEMEVDSQGKASPVVEVVEVAAPANSQRGIAESIATDDLKDSSTEAWRAELDVVWAELEETEGLIQQHDRKIRLLTSLRNSLMKHVLSSEKGGVEGSNWDVEQLRKLIEQTEQDVLRKSLESKYTVSFEATEVEAPMNLFDRYFVERASIQSMSPIVDAQFLEFHSPKTDRLVLLVVADSAGRLSFYNMYGEVLGTHQLPEQSGGVKGISCFSKTKKPVMITYFDSGEILVHDIVLWKKGDPAPMFGNGLNVPSEKTFTHPFAVTLSLDHTIRASAQVSSAVVGKFHSQNVVAVALKNGNIDVYHTNGTILQSMTTPSHIDRIIPHAEMLALSNGTDVTFYEVSKGAMASEHSRCFGTTDVVTSIAFDPLSSFMMYTATRRGDVIVFHTRTKLSSHDQLGCRMLYRLPTKDWMRRTMKDGGEVALLKGYLFSLVGDELQVFNTTSTVKGAPRFLCSHALPLRTKGSTWKGNRLLKTHVSPTIRNSNIGYLAWKTEDARIVLYEAILPHSTLTNDFGDMRFLIIGGFVVVVFIWQLRKYLDRQEAKASTRSRSTFEGMPLDDSLAAKELETFMQNRAMSGKSKYQ